MSSPLPPGTPSSNAKAAHEFLTELTTRIATQRLPYRDGDEQSALDSLNSIFPKAREIIAKHHGCSVAQAAIEKILNEHLRNFTAHWHALSLKGHLAGRDGADKFREDLINLQDKVRKEAERIAAIAQERLGPNDRVSLHWPDEDEEEPARLKEAMAPLAFGIPEDSSLLPQNSGVTWSDINEAERRAVQARRSKVHGEPGSRCKACTPQVQPDSPTNAIGLALSGGGIRSAAFSLGVTQVLGERRMLKDVDYLSTVSGGGYTGSFITQRLGCEGAPSPDSPEYPICKPHGPDTKAIRYLRMRAKYLSGDSTGSRWLMASHVIAGTLLNWLSPLFILMLPAAILAMVHLIWLEPPSRSGTGTNAPTATVTNATGTRVIDNGAGIKNGGDVSNHAETMEAKWIRRAQDFNKYLWIGISLFGSILYGWRLRVLKDSTAALNSFVKVVAYLGGLSMFIGLALLALSNMDKVSNWLGTFAPGDNRAGRLGEWVDTFLAYPVEILGGAAMLGALGRFIHAMGNARVRKAIVRTGLLLGLLLVPITALAIEHLLLECAHGTFAGHDSTKVAMHRKWLLGVTVAIGVIVLFAIDVNRTSPRPLYQGRLARAFIKEKDDGPEVPLTEINPSGTAPIHILNSALNIPSSSEAGMRERGCDFFSFTKFYCGAPSIGYAKTNEWTSHNEPVALDVAMAVSAAAASSRMGLYAMPGTAPLLTMLNIRLGYWLLKPWIKGRSDVPGAFRLFSEMFGHGMDEKADWVNLSDGGHIENTGAYELLRRRCKFILCVDGEADPDFGFSGIMTLVRHARIDMGIDMKPRLDELRPKEKGRPSRSHFAIWEIKYPKVNRNGARLEEHDTGFFLYLKLSLTGNERELLQTYKARNPEFPHQSTTDQFFDQEQFEAYRGLGVHVAEMLFKPALLRRRGDYQSNTRHSDPLDAKPNSDSCNENVHCLADLFERIAGNMLC